MHGIAAITGNMHRSLRYFVLLEHIISKVVSFSSRLLIVIFFFFFWGGGGVLSVVLPLYDSFI